MKDLKTNYGKVVSVSDTDLDGCKDLLHCLPLVPAIREVWLGQPKEWHGINGTTVITDVCVVADSSVSKDAVREIVSHILKGNCSVSVTSDLCESARSNYVWYYYLKQDLCIYRKGKISFTSTKDVTVDVGSSFLDSAKQSFESIQGLLESDIKSQSLFLGTILHTIILDTIKHIIRKSISCETALECNIQSILLEYNNVIVPKEILESQSLLDGYRQDTAWVALDDSLSSDETLKTLKSLIPVIDKWICDVDESCDYAMYSLLEEGKTLEVSIKNGKFGCADMQDAFKDGEILLLSKVGDYYSISSQTDGRELLGVDSFDYVKMIVDDFKSQEG